MTTTVVSTNTTAAATAYTSSSNFSPCLWIYSLLNRLYGSVRSGAWQVLQSALGNYVSCL